MFDIFINYRACDARFGAAATFELLADRFGRARIFLDNQSMRPGSVYPDELRAALQSMRVLLVLIGPNWLAEAGDGAPLIHRGEDWVRREIRTAIERRVPIVPVLLDGVALPDPNRLPADVRPLLHRQAVEVRHQTLGTDVGRLAERLTDLVSAVRPRSAVPRQLPAGTGHFVGRAGHLDHLDEMLLPPSDGGPALAVLSGTAGVGKTALAVHWGHRAKHAFPDGQLYVDLRGFGAEQPISPAEALSILLRSLGVSQPDEFVDIDERAAQFRTLMSGRRALVVLDNARSVGQVRRLIPGDGPSAVLVTSRSRLGGLPVLHAAGRLELGPLDHGDAVRLLVGIVGRRAVAEPAAADELVRRCAHLPLAVRIAAERVVSRPALRLAELLAELADLKLDALSTDDAGSAIRTVFSWSYQGLAERAARMFRAFGLHPGQDSDLFALTALTGMDATDARASVASLLTVHLVAEPAAGRYEMHDLLRDYAREVALTDGPGEREVGLERLFDHYLHTADRADRLLTPHRYRLPCDGDSTAGLTVDDADHAREWFDSEDPNLVALCRLDEVRFDSRRWQLAYALRGYYYLTKKLDNWTETHHAALAATIRLGDRRAEGITRNNLGMALVARGLLDEAMAQYRVAEQLLAVVGDGHGVSNALANQAAVLRRRGAYDEALRNQRRALAYYRRTNVPRNVGITLRSMARVHIERGSFADAARCAEEALDTALGLRHNLDVAQAYNVLGMVRHLSGERVLAEVALHQAVEFGARCASLHEQARAARRLGALAADAGEAETATRWWRTALELLAEMGSAEAEAVATDLEGLTQ